VDDNVQNVHNEQVVTRMLVVLSGAQLCALPLGDVVEILRPLPVSELAGAPGFVRGLSVIRGAPVPVVDLGQLLGAKRGDGPDALRVVTVRVGQNRRVALLVDAVLGLRSIEAATLGVLPPLFTAAQTVVSALGALDRELLVVLGAGRLISDEVWQRIGSTAT
jgi:purine-binding chemotaxis protein CheW